MYATMYVQSIWLYEYVCISTNNPRTDSYRIIAVSRKDYNERERLSIKCRQSMQEMKLKLPNQRRDRKVQHFST